MKNIRRNHFKAIFKGIMLLKTPKIAIFQEKSQSYCRILDKKPSRKGNFLRLTFFYFISKIRLAHQITDFGGF